MYLFVCVSSLVYGPLWVLSLSEIFYAGLTLFS